MARNTGACLICREPLMYFETEREMECSICHHKFMSRASCIHHHYVCDSCHSKKGLEEVMQVCLETDSTNPIKIMQQLMEYPYIYMHGPEHHVMVGAALMAAYHNSGGEINLKEALKEMFARGRKVPGGVCGFWGSCGAAVSTGMFVSIITQSTPLSGKSWGQSNCMTAAALNRIGSLGGPRCCKRNSFSAVLEAVPFVKEITGVEMELPEKVVCTFSKENKQCIGKKCPYHARIAER